MSDQRKPPLCDCDLHPWNHIRHRCCCVFDYDHDDDGPLAECEYHAALRRERDAWKREAELNAEAADQSADYASRLAITLDLLRQHGIHVDEKWCWCEPTVEDHRDGK